MEKFKDKNELNEALLNAFYLERDYELVQQYKNSLNIPKEWEKLLLILSLESKEHEDVLYEIIKGFKDFKQPEKTRTFKILNFNFEKLNDEGIYELLIETEKKMQKLYEEIYNRADEKDIVNNFSYSLSLFFWSIKSLAKAEKEHQELINSYYLSIK